MNSPVNTAPRMITAAMTGRNCPIEANAAVWPGFGVFVAEPVGFGVDVELDVNAGVEVGVRVGVVEAVDVGVGEGIAAGNGANVAVIV